LLPVLFARSCLITGAGIISVLSHQQKQKRFVKLLPDVAWWNHVNHTASIRESLSSHFNLRKLCSSGVSFAEQFSCTLLCPLTAKRKTIATLLCDDFDCLCSSLSLDDFVLCCSLSDGKHFFGFCRDRCDFGDLLSSVSARTSA
jgi:hypothetical protein